MRICYVIDQLDCGGAEQQLVTLCQGLKRRGHDVRVIAIHDRMALRNELDGAGVPIAVAHKHGTYDLSAAWRLRGLIRRAAPDLVHAYLPAAALLAPLSRWLGVTAPVLQSERGVNDWRSPFRLRIENIIRSRVAHITCNAEAIKRYLVDAEGVVADKITVIYNGLRADRRNRPDERSIADARQRIGAPAGCATVICVANFSPVKQHDVLLSAAAEARAQGTRLYLVLVGSGPLEQPIRRRAADLGLTDSLRVITDCVNPLALLCASDIATLPSLLEGCSNALLEAMAAGLPIATSDAGGNRELVIDGLGGYVYPVRDAMACARALMRLAAEPQAAFDMGRYNQRRIADQFTDDIMVERTLALYRAVLRARVPALSPSTGKGGPEHLAITGSIDEQPGNR